MLLLDNKWERHRYFRKKYVQYQKSAFYGPFVDLILEEFEDGTKKVTPVSIKIETAQVSASAFSLLSNVSEELYSKIGEFTLVIPNFKTEVKINSKDAEELIIDGLVKSIKENLPLF